MKCPNCGAPRGDGAAECASCGLIFAKWRARPLEPGVRSAPVDPSRARVIAGAVVVLWLVIFAIYVRSGMKSARRPLGEPTGDFVEMRDPKTGDMKRMPIRRLGAPPGSTTSSGQ